MSQKSRVVLKTKFESGRTPTEEDFSDLLDSGLNKLDDQIVVRHMVDGSEEAKYIGIGSADPESPISIKNRSGNSNLIGFENENGDEKWRIEIDPEGAGEGLNIAEKDNSDANLFIQSGGKVGIGTRMPDEQLEIKGKVKADEFIGKVDWSKLDNVPNTFFVPQGGIIMWSGEAVDIPEGWTLCNGENGAPDLRDRFIVGAGSPNYNVHDIGGLENVQITVEQMPSHNHSGSTNSAGNHRHGVHGTNHNNTPDSVDYSNFEYGAYINNHTHTEYAGSHSHSLTTNSKGGSQPHENRPPYYALCFIMKI